MKIILIMLLFAVLFSGCVEQKEQKLSNLSTPEPQVTQVTPTPQEIPENASSVVELAKKNLSEKLKIPATSIQVIKVIPVEWPDSSMGHPEPGKVYMPVITPGYVIILLVDNTLYEYHSDYEHVVAINLTKKS